MRTLLNLFRRPVSNDTFDRSLVLWACSGAAVLVLILATVLFSRHAQGLAQLLSGLALTFVTCAVLFWTGISTQRLDLAIRTHKVPVRSRWFEFTGYVCTFVILIAGIRYLPSLPLERPGMTIGLLAVLSASMVPVCLGAWSTLRIVARMQNMNHS